MPYKSYPGNYRRRPGLNLDIHPKDNPADKRSESIEAASIPLPNILEEEAPRESPMQSRKKPILDFFKDHIQLEDIILIGLVLLLINEGIEDEMLIILIVYIFLA